MANYSTNLTTWGDTGASYPAGYSYLDGEQPVDAWDNFTNYNLIEDVKHLISLTNDRLESTKGTTRPTSPEEGQLFFDTDGDLLEVYDGAAWFTVAKKATLDAHTSDTTNPHSVTYTQVGAIQDANNTVTRSHLNFDLGVDVSDGGTLIVNEATDINFGSNLSVTDDGDGTITVAAANSPDTHLDVKEDGATLVSDVSYIDFLGHLNVVDQLDGGVTIDPTHTHTLGELSDVSATGEGSGGGFDADTVDGSHASAFATAGHTHALGDLSNVTAAGEGSGNGFDADTVDGQHASALELADGYDIQLNGTDGAGIINFKT